MRPTRLGLYAAAMAAFTLFAAGSTGNNLLYLLFAATTSALAVGGVVAFFNLGRLTVRVEMPDQAFRGSAFPARVVVENAGPGAARLLSVVGPLGAARVGDVAAGGSARAELRLVLPHRGLNRVDGLVLESLYPFGFFTCRRAVPAFEALALPPAGPFAPQAELTVDPRARSEGARRKGREGEFFGPRPYLPEDDAREIHWKLTAKTGRPVVAEHAAAPQGKAIVRLDGTDEAAVERAAAACRWHIDCGTETGLLGPGVEVEPARGLGQLDRLLRALALVGAGAEPRRAPSAPGPRDEGPEDARALRRLTFLGGLLVFASLFLIEELSPWALLACAPLLPLGFLLHERGGPFPPARLWNAVSVLFLAYFLLVDWRRSGVALANAHLLGYLLVNRLFNPWSRRELRQVLLILYLAFFLVSGLTISPWYFPLFVAWLVFGGAWLLLQSGAEPARPSAWLPSLGRLLAAGAALGAAVFLAVPRVEGLRRFNPFVASGMDKLQIRSASVMGFTDRVTLGWFGTLRRSSARALRVRPEEAPAAAAPPVYVRGAAFDRFDGRVWDKSPLDFRWTHDGTTSATKAGRAWAKRGGAALAFPAAKGGGSYYDVDVYPMRVSVLFTVGAPRLVDGISDAAWFDHTDSFYVATGFSTGARYRVYQAPPGSEPTDAAPGLRARTLALALQTPPDPDGRVAALAARWTKGLADPRLKADAIAAHLQREYAYSTHSDGGLATLPDFLFKTRRGNCEYFATAAAVLMRHAGVPARLVTGFRADDWNQWGKFYDVRQSQAHAWVEAWLPGKGWTLYDATPAESGFSAAAESVSRRLGLWLDAAQSRWYRSVIGYDQYAQRDTFLRLSFGLAVGRVRAFLDRVLRAGLPAALLLGLLIWGVRSAPALLRRGDEYERAERALARAGLKRRPDQTPREYARDVAARRPELSELSELVEQHYERRYAGREPGEERRARARAALASIKERL